MGSSFAALRAGKIDTIIVIKIEHVAITKIEDEFISEGIVLRKYISSGNNVMSKIVLNSCLKFSTYFAKTTPNRTPKKVAEAPIETPIKKKIFIIDLFNTPIDFNIAISRVLFLTKIVRPEIILNAATIIIRVKIINITFLSTFKAENNELFISDQL